LNRQKLTLAAVLIAAYGLGSIAFYRVFPELSDDPLGAHVDAFFAFFAVLFLVVIAVTSTWRFVGLVGRDQVPAIRWIVVLFVLELLLLLAYFGASLLGYSGAEGAIVIVVINIAFVAFNEEVLFRGFLWGAVDGFGPAKRILFVSFIFGLFHIVNAFTGESWGSALFQVGLVFLASIMDGVIRYGTGSLWPTIVLHFLWDSSGIFGKGNVADTLGPALQFLIVLAGVTSLIVIALKHRRTTPALETPATTG